MKAKIVVVVLLLLSLGTSFIVGVASADETVTGTISPSSSVIYVGSSVTITCTYTSSLSLEGIGTLQISGPASDPTDPDAFDSWTNIHYWDGGTGTKHSPLLTSGVPVEFTQQLNSVGYYMFRWLCSSVNGTDGAWTEVMVLVIEEPPPPVPEGSSIAVFAVSLATVGAFAIIAKKRNTPKKVE